MRYLVEPTRGLAVAGIALLTVLGGMALGLNESGHPLTATPLAQATRPPTETLFVPSPIIPTFAFTFDPNALPTQPPVSEPSATPCPPPVGWSPVVIGPGETLFALAARHGSSPQTVAQANCLTTDSPLPGTTIYLPVTPPTLPAAAAVCGPPLGWVYYTVQPGDTLFRLSLRYNVSIYALRQANCIPGISITVGQNIFVPPTAPIIDTAPPLPTPTPIPPTPTDTPSAAPPPADTATEAPLIPTDTPSPEPPPTLAATPTATNTATDAPSESPTPTATDSPTPTPTETVSG